MKKLIKYLVIFGFGLIVGLFFLYKSKNNHQTQQIDVITQGIKNVSKLVVTEATFSEIYSYKDADTYFFETIAFEKKAILFVEAKVQVSYDLKKMDFEIDSLNKKLLIKSLPKEEIELIPNFKYYDLQQSMWNAFTKDELNKIQKNSLDRLMETAVVADIKTKASQRLVAELQSLLNIANLIGWEIEDKTQNHFFNSHNIKAFKD